MSAIEDRVETFPEPWKPAPGDKIVGRIAAVGTRTSEYGDYPLIDLVKDDGTEVTIHGFHTVLKNELARQRPDAGDRIAVKYFGKDEKAGYERYRVLVEKEHPEGGVNWDAMAEPDSPPE